MGIYDREYYRRDGPSFLGSFVERGQICKWIIGINVACYILQLLTGENTGWFTNLFVLDVDKVLHGEVWRLVTHAFLHSPHDLWHIVFNMALLWWFGSDMEDHYGRWEFLAFYLLAAVAGGLGFTLAGMAGLNGGIIGGHQQALGASGAVTAVLVLCAFHYPSRVLYVFFFLPVPIWLFVIGSVAFDCINFLNQQHSGVAVTGHLGGALFGFLYYQQHWHLLNAWSRLRTWQRQLFRPRLRVYREEPREPVHVAAPPPSRDVDEQLEAKLDAVLEKVARSGQDSLNDHERQILMRASEIYKRRRT
jgi:membrane associated rhomboid family serine protease